MNSKFALKCFLASLLMAMVAWEIYVNIFASRSVISFITRYELDKFMHFLGGIFIAGTLFLIRRTSGLFSFVVIIFIIALSWEMIELIFDPKVAYFFGNNKYGWIIDMMKDIVFSFAGTLFFWAITRNRLKRSFPLSEPLGNIK